MDDIVQRLQHGDVIVESRPQCEVRLESQVPLDIGWLGEFRPSRLQELWTKGHCAIRLYLIRAPQAPPLVDHASLGPQWAIEPRWCATWKALLWTSCLRCLKHLLRCACSSMSSGTLKQAMRQSRRNGSTAWRGRSGLKLSMARRLPACMTHIKNHAEELDSM